MNPYPGTPYYLSAKRRIGIVVINALGLITIDDILERLLEILRNIIPGEDSFNMGSATLRVKQLLQLLRRALKQRSLLEQLESFCGVSN